MPDPLIVLVSARTFADLSRVMPVHSVGEARWIIGSCNGVALTFVVRGGAAAREAVDAALAEA